MRASDIDQGWAPIIKKVDFPDEEHPATFNWCSIPVREGRVADEFFAGTLFRSGTEGIGLYG